MIFRRRRVAPNIDRLILSFAGIRWMKVAKIVGKVSTALEKEGRNVDLLKIAVRLEALVGAGLLELKGNVKRWRYSEVRRPASPRPRRKATRRRSRRLGNPQIPPVERSIVGSTMPIAERSHGASI